MTRRYRFVQVDVFTNRPFGGNQLAVFTDAQGLTGDEMQTLTREMNFSECSFVLPSEIDGASKRLRIFSPRREMAMAGHPTIGTTWVLMGQQELSSTRSIIEETLQIGTQLIKVSIEKHDGNPPFIWMAQRQPEFGKIRSDPELVAGALDIELEDIDLRWPMQIVSTGVRVLIVPIRSLEAIGRCRSDASRLASLFGHGDGVEELMFTNETTSSEAQVHAGMFPPHVSGPLEDAATGATAGPLGAYLVKHGILRHMPRIQFVEEQGIEMGRPSQIHVEICSDGDTIRTVRVGGEAVIVGQGEIFWD